MKPLKTTKTLLIGGWFLGLLLWVGAGHLPHSTGTAKAQNQHQGASPAGAQVADANYVGSETCRMCHEDQFKNFSHTPHAGLEQEASWHGRVVGCESCHGPGKAHVDAGGDPTKIINPKKLSAKASSESCLTCHAGSDDHNNFRRGSHWRNDVGCVDCHAPHDPSPGPTRPGSTTLVTGDVRRNPESTSLYMLRASEPQICLKCHSEQRAQFNMPFRHRVLEGAMKCSDCHNPHGGFETRQVRLASGTDAPCLKCHADKQGPFVFEHAPVKTEGCTICHTPHGSNNPRLLVRTQIRQLCLECHSNAHEIGAPNTPNFHNEATVRFQNCTTCHAKIHGSNVSRTFFR